jgi:phosphoglycerate dehydrogenase-like enzyme
MTKPKVLISDKMDPNAAKIFEERGCDVDVKPGMTPDELKAVIGEYDGLAIRSATKVTREILDAATNLKVIGRAGIGVDNVDIPYASSKGVVVMNTPFGNSITTAEHAIAMIMSLARQIPAADARTKAGEWPKNDFMGVEVTGKTLGLIGAGNIGSIVANRAQGLKMRVVAFDPFLTEDRAVEIGVEKVDLDTLLAKADFITLHTPLTDQTRNILSKENLAKTKKGVRIVNCARGGLIDEEALKEALESGHVAGAALDVFVTGLHLHPASRCIDHRSAGQCRAASGRTAQRLPRPWRSDQRAQHAEPQRRRSAQAQALYGAGRTARLARRPAGPWQSDRNQHRARRCSCRSQRQADRSGGAGGLHAPVFRQCEHGQRAASREGARARRAFDPS